MSEEKKQILVIDDEALVRESLSLILSRQYEVRVAENGDTALRELEEIASGSLGNVTAPDCILLDLMMPGTDGIGVLAGIQKLYPSVPVIMLTASNGVKSAVEAMKLGAVDYLNKPYDVDELLSLIEEVLRDGAVGREAASTHSTFRHERSLPDSGTFGIITGEHPLMLELFEKIEQVAPREATVLITGESGTGKELVAREIHSRSERQEGPFIALNCAAIPDALIESELFGHTQGAFTHALEERIGQFELADKGTLFLDEIGELSPEVQVKMLRFLSDREFCKVGSSEPKRVDVRVLAATNRNLQVAIEEKLFRKDLFYRINVVRLELPALRDRVEDIPSLAQGFVEKLSGLYQDRKISFDAESLEALHAYSWPGNVRELENVVESLLALSTKSEITISDLPKRLQLVESINSGLDSTDEVLSFDEAERVFETDIIIKALKRANYVQTKAAEILGISRRILKYKMDKLGINSKGVV